MQPSVSINIYTEADFIEDACATNMKKSVSTKIKLFPRYEYAANSPVAN